jgi:hypothetical protein
MGRCGGDLPRLPGRESETIWGRQATSGVDLRVGAGSLGGSKAALIRASGSPLWTSDTRIPSSVTASPKCFALPPLPDPDRELAAETATKLITEVRADLERLRWFLWHGNVFRALTTVEDIIIDLETLNPDDEPSKLLTAAREFDGYLRANVERIPNYGERRRAGEAISTAFTESTVNQVISKRMVKKQQMRWTPRGAHLLLQIRTRVLNDQLSADFHRWYPNLTQEPDLATLTA